MYFKIFSFFILLFVFACPGYTEWLNIDIGDYYGTPSSSFGAASGQVGVWNSIANGTSSKSQLLDIAGNTTDVAISLSFTHLGGNSGGSTNNEGAALVDDNFYSTSNFAVTFSGLNQGTYTLYYYGPSHPSVDLGNFTANGTSASGVPGAAFNGTWIQGTHYNFISVNVAANGILSLSGGFVGSYAGLAGLQLIASGTPPIPPTVPTVPEPTSFVLCAMALLGWFCYKKTV